MRSRAAIPATTALLLLINPSSIGLARDSTLKSFDNYANKTCWAIVYGYVRKPVIPKDGFTDFAHFHLELRGVIAGSVDPALDESLFVDADLMNPFDVGSQLTANAPVIAFVTRWGNPWSLYGGNITLFPTPHLSAFKAPSIDDSDYSRTLKTLGESWREAPPPQGSQPDAWHRPRRPCEYALVDGIVAASEKIDSDTGFITVSPIRSEPKLPAGEADRVRVYVADSPSLVRYPAVKVGARVVALTTIYQETHCTLPIRADFLDGDGVPFRVLTTNAAKESQDLFCAFKRAAFWDCHSVVYGVVRLASPQPKKQPTAIEFFPRMTLSGPFRPISVEKLTLAAGQRVIGAVSEASSPNAIVVIHQDGSSWNVADEDVEFMPDRNLPIRFVQSFDDEKVEDTLNRLRSFRRDDAAKQSDSRRGKKGQ